MDWIERTGGLHQWTRGDERAPHKPLLMLYALGRFQRDPEEALRYSDVERDLHALLRAYGPPRATTPAYPFHHLRTDGLWEVRPTTAATARVPTWVRCARAARPGGSCRSCGRRSCASRTCSGSSRTCCS